MKPVIDWTCGFSEKCFWISRSVSAMAASEPMAVNELKRIFDGELSGDTVRNLLEELRNRTDAGMPRGAAAALAMATGKVGANSMRTRSARINRLSSGSSGVTLDRSGSGNMRAWQLKRIRSLSSLLLADLSRLRCLYVNQAPLRAGARPMCPGLSGFFSDVDGEPG